MDSDTSTFPGWLLTIIIAAIIVVAIIIIVIVAVKNNKNLTANGEIKGNKLGLSLTDSENTDSKNQLVYDMIINMKLSKLKTHPLYSTVFPHILYKDNSMDKLQAIAVSVKSDSNQLQVTRNVFAAMQLIRKYIVSFKFYSENILKSIENDINNPTDKKNTSTIKSIEAFINDVEIGSIINTTIDNVKTTGFLDDHNNTISSSVVSDNVFQFFYNNVKNRTSDLYRDLLIAKTYMFSPNSNPFERNFTMIMGVSQLYDAILEHVYSIYVEMRTEYIVKVCEIEDEDVDTLEEITVLETENS